MKEALHAYCGYKQIALPCNIAYMIPPDDPIHSFEEVFDHIDLYQYFRAEGTGKGRPPYDRAALTKIVIFAFLARLHRGENDVLWPVYNVQLMTADGYIVYSKTTGTAAPRLIPMLRLCASNVTLALEAFTPVRAISAHCQTSSVRPYLLPRTG